MQPRFQSRPSRCFLAYGRPVETLEATWGSCHQARANWQQYKGTRPIYCRMGAWKHQEYRTHQICMDACRCRQNPFLPESFVSPQRTYRRADTGKREPGKESIRQLSWKVINLGMYGEQVLGRLESDHQTRQLWRRDQSEKSGRKSRWVNGERENAVAQDRRERANLPNHWRQGRVGFQQ
jgi:hypothetical protein